MYLVLGITSSVQTFGFDDMVWGPGRWLRGIIGRHISDGCPILTDLTIWASATPIRSRTA